MGAGRRREEPVGDRAEQPRQRGEAPHAAHELAALQRTAGNRAVTELVVQRKAGVAHTPAKKVPGLLAADDVLAPYVGKGGGAALKVKVHGRDDFKKAFLDYAAKKQVANAQGQVGVTAAFTDLEAGVIHLDKDRGDPGTIVHEALHLRSSRTWVEDHHSKVNEGTTELFTRRVCAAAGITRGADSYPEHLGAIEKLLTKTSIEALAKAYFTNDASALEKDLDGIRSGFWLEWQATISQSITKANALVP
jgi:hypothetical protein